MASAWETLSAVERKASREPEPPDRGRRKSSAVHDALIDVDVVVGSAGGVVGLGGASSDTSAVEWDFVW